MNIIENALKQAGDHSNPLQIKKLKGGEINECCYVQTKKQAYVIKYHEHAPEGFFSKEAVGLERIKSTNTVATPEVYTYRDQPGASFIVMEWIDGVKGETAEEKLAEQIAAMHQTYAASHGFTEDTYVGTLRQPNGLYTSWLEYYRDRRLSNQRDIGIRNGRITGERGKRLEKLLAELERWVPSDVPASFLHGDLWGENWLQNIEGEPYVIDPSFLYGDRHFELAYMELFGGFTRHFFDVYESCLPRSDTYYDVKAIYQLYYLLVHLNIFGEIYGPRVDDILARYVSN